MLLNCHLLPLEKAWLRFSPCNLVSSLLIVGDDVLGVPFIKISLRFARTTGGRPYRFGGGFDIVIVGTGVA